MSLFVCVLYILSLIGCTFGLYHAKFNANFLQRVALILFAFWFVWRITLVYQHGWGYQHEPLIAMAIAIFTLGTIVKTLRWK